MTEQKSHQQLPVEEEEATRKGDANLVDPVSGELSRCGFKTGSGEGYRLYEVTECVLLLRISKWQLQPCHFVPLSFTYPQTLQIHLLCSLEEPVSELLFFLCKMGIMGFLSSLALIGL